MERWIRSHSRGLVIGVICTITAGVIAAVIVLSALVLTSGSPDYSDSLVAAGDVIAAGTLALALIAAVVAVLAYAAATGRPDLKIQVKFGQDSLPNYPYYIYSPGLVMVPITNIYGTGEWQISLRNVSYYSARSPAVVVRLQGLAADEVERPDDSNWLAVDHRELFGITGVQWDAGPSNSVHGHSTRRLPPLDFGELRYDVKNGPSPHIVLELLAEGYRRVVRIPVGLITLEDADKLGPKPWRKEDPLPWPWI